MRSSRASWPSLRRPAFGGFGREQIQTQGCRPIGLRLLQVRRGQVAENLAHMFVGDAAVGLEPVPGLRLDERQLLGPADDRLPRHAEIMREHDDVSPADFVGPGRHLLELLHHRPRRRQQRAPERIRVTLLSRVRVFITEEYLRLPARGEEVAGLVRGGLNAALAPDDWR